MLVGDDGRAHVRASEGVDPAVIAGLSGRLDEQLIARVEKAAGRAGPIAPSWRCR